MKSFDRRLVGVAMRARAHQWRTRVALAVIVAAIFFTMTGPLFALGWLALYALLQWAELGLFKARSRADSWKPTAKWCWTAVLFIGSTTPCSAHSQGGRPSAGRSWAWWPQPC